ncbi:MAG TPA: class I SAM-dependent methyltransferase [Methanoregulaceae archaeon]|nr:class I SAM-dependent methyltransferase [Methanoregulaceae archaeon]
MSKDFSEKSYKKHEKHFKQYARGGDKENHANTWFDSTTVDAWRHQRMRRSIDPLLSDLDASWLTVGDGRYGTDAHYIFDKGVKNVIATDISDYLLREGKEKGFIPKFQKENAENLSFSDGEFDYVLCKEAYHHFPRPVIALYEMLRVCKKAVVLIEPNDPNILKTNRQIFFFGIKNIIKKRLNKKIEAHSFEESGNYVYSISAREMEKIALGINLSIIAYKGINDWYIEGVEYEKSNTDSLLFLKVKKIIHIQNIFSTIGLINWGLLVIIIFKEIPTESMREKLKIEGYKIIDLPKNPYIQ